MRSSTKSGLVVASAALASSVTAAVDLKWYAPNATQINNLTSVLSGSGVYDFVYNNSYPTDVPYGTYDWCNMPHVRKEEYAVPSKEYKLKFVELIHRHHKRTVYASNSFPVESYGWNCDDEGLYYYGQPASGNKSAHTYWTQYTNPINPFKVSGFTGSCQFPQITKEGLDDAYQHGKDLYGVYHDLLKFLPDDSSKAAEFRVTQNTITSQVAGMVIAGMFGSTEDHNLRIMASGIDSLEPTYSCSTSSAIYSSEKSSTVWNNHLTAASSLYSTLDNISGVSSTDSGFHASFDHYYDNLSARQCHAKPLPCKLVDGKNSTTCVTQEIADSVYRLGNWEYSYIYRDSSTSLNAAVGSYGVWIAELATHIRAVLDGSSEAIYHHQVAHDGSISRLLSFLQLDVMVWPGMGSEVVFEVWEKTATDGTPTPTTLIPQPSITAPTCNHDNCLRQLIGKPAEVAVFCPSYTKGAQLPSWISNCQDNADRVASACSCLVTSTSTTSTSSPTTTATAASSSSSSSSTATSASGHYMRVLFGGKVLRSSNPTLGYMDMVPLENVLAYFDGLVGVGASLVLGKCSGATPY